jgi:hypothetical protein
MMLSIMLYAAVQRSRHTALTWSVVDDGPLQVRQVSTPTFEQLGHTSYHERLEELAETPGKPFMPGTSYVYELTR